MDHRRNSSLVLWTATKREVRGNWTRQRQFEVSNQCHRGRPLPEMRSSGVAEAQLHKRLVVKREEHIVNDDSEKFAIMTKNDVRGGGLVSSTVKLEI